MNTTLKITLSFWPHEYSFDAAGSWHHFPDFLVSVISQEPESGAHIP